MLLWCLDSLLSSLARHECRYEGGVLPVHITVDVVAWIDRLRVQDLKPDSPPCR